MKKTFSLLVAGLISLAALTSCGNSSLPNYSGDGACYSLASLINQLGLMEIQDLDTFYRQIDAIIAQANTAAATDAKFGEMASQVQSFARVWMEKFPNAVPNYLGTIPLQATSDDFCGTDFASQG